jgi:two-component system phosphate regulon sensor histidine kinase PhoR
MADSLTRQQQTLLQFVSDVSHELKTPLSSLRSLCDALEGGALDKPAEATKFLAYIHQDLDRMEKLVGDLLQLHKIDQAVVKLQPRPLELQPYLENLAERMRPSLAPAKLELVVSPSQVVADPERLEQILVNLLENARRAVVASPAPQIRLEARGSTITVSDNGVGLAQENLERIFDRFYRVDSARSRQEGGTGLGLAITRGLAGAMGGTIQASSPGLGQGAIFTLILH